MRRVVTYQPAYPKPFETFGGSISLCREHRDDKSADRPLGPVLHGEHWGDCDACRRLAAEAKRAEVQP